MTVYAAQASFFIILSAFPFIMLVLTVLQLIPTFNQEDVIQILLAILPHTFQAYEDMITNVVYDLYTNSPGTILSITGITALWSAARGMLSIERGFNRVAGCAKRRNYIVSRLICSGYTIVFVVVCIMSLVLLVLGNSLQNFIYRYIPILQDISNYLINFRTLIAIAILFLFFTGLYSFLPIKRLPTRKQFPGAAFATVGWIGFSFVFSIYFTNFSHFSYMYGSLTAIVLLMLWLYICICILFLGAELNYYLSFQGYKSGGGNG